MRKGFTLIEVLIVVIILGILATLAIPQFSKMTNRARLAEAWAGLGGVRTAQAVYYMTKEDSYADDLAHLDFDVPTGGIFSYSMIDGDGTDYNCFANGTGDAAGITAWINTTCRGYSLP